MPRNLIRILSSYALEKIPKKVYNIITLFFYYVAELCPPCGVCRQVMSEFCGGDFKIILSNGETYRVMTLDEILPARFDLLN